MKKDESYGVFREKKLIYENNGFKAEVKIIRDHDISIDTVLVKSALGEHWIQVNKLKKGKL